MEFLNYHHLRYFWLAANHGSLSSVARLARISHSAVSTQVKQLEEALGGPLFIRRPRRRLALTPLGEQVFQYAETIFRTGAALLDVAHGRSTGPAQKVTVGVTPEIPGTLVQRVLGPMWKHATGISMEVQRGTHDLLLPELAMHRLHLVLSGRPHANGFNNLHAVQMVKTGMLFYAAPRLAARLRPGFPGSLHDAPAVLPPPRAPLRLALDGWFASPGVTPRVVATSDDTGLWRALGIQGLGFFPVRAILAQELDNHGAHRVGEAGDVFDAVYAVLPERRLVHPAVRTLLDARKAAGEE